jgi:hypothetical protein
LAVSGFFLLTLGGMVWPNLGRLGTSRLLVLALCCATVPAVYSVDQVMQVAEQWTGDPRRGLALGCGLLLAAGLGCRQSALVLAQRCLGASPLEIGLGAEREAVIEVLQNLTRADARILWEERQPSASASGWSALLSHLTQRSFIGGLDPTICIEHAFPRLVEGNLAGRPISDWSDTELDQFCRRYNVGWAVCWSSSSQDRLRSWQAAKPIISVIDGGPGWLFSLPGHSYVLKGQARLLEADTRRIALADLVPDQGVVLLSMHFQAGIQASPDRVRVERDPDPYDPIPFIRLRVPGPAARVTLTLETMSK